MEEAEPSPYDALIATWAQRDNLWAQNIIVPDPTAVEAARAVRMREVNLLPVKFRAAAFARVKTWYPPQHGQGQL